MDMRARNRLNKLLDIVRAELSDTTLSTGKMSFWVCQECGQSYFGNEPPGYCSYCEHDTEWEISSIA